MKKSIITVIRAVLVLAFLILAQLFTNWIKGITSQTFQIVPYALYLSGVSILFGAVLRSDIFFIKNKTFKVDWLSLLLIGVPSLLIVFFVPFLFLFLANVSLPSFVEVLWGDQIRVFAAVVFGYTVINSLFVVQGE